MPRTNTRPQAAALPIHNNKVCLITTSSGQGVIIPKGNVPDGMHPADLAEREAWEEAGLVGRIDREPFGDYTFQKSGEELTVQVYLLEVTEWSFSWPEQQSRQRIWCSVEKAVDRVSHVGLRELMVQYIEARTAINGRG